jgi:SAM-dependent methyltransferase
MPIDPSKGYDAVADDFIAARSPTIGVATLRSWCRFLPKGCDVLDLGCGFGVPVSATLMDEGHPVYGVEASPRLTDAFRRRFAGAQVACETVEQSSLFGRPFDAVVSVGLMFFLSADAQRDLIRRVADALKPGGHFLFTAPLEHAAWTDIMSGLPSQSLGEEGYTAALSAAGLVLLAEYWDEGDNHYFAAVKDLSARKQITE